MLLSIGDYLAGSSSALRRPALSAASSLTSWIGPSLNRDAVGNVQKAGFRLRRWKTSISML